MSWIVKLIYTLLIVVLLAQPHLITGHVFFLPRAYAHSVVTVILLALAYLTYRLHRWEIARRYREQQAFERKLEASAGKLLDAHRYLGKVNRRLPLLNELTTNLLARFAVSVNGRKEVFHRLLAIAVTSIAKADWGCFRFIELTHRRTVREFCYPTLDEARQQVRVDNQALLRARAQPSTAVLIGQHHVVMTSDRHAPVQCFLILPQRQLPFKDEHLVVQAIVDQAQLFSQYLS